MKINIFALYTHWETLEKNWFTLPHFPVHVYICFSIIGMINFFSQKKMTSKLLKLVKNSLTSSRGEKVLAQRLVLILSKKVT